MIRFLQRTGSLVSNMRLPTRKAEKERLENQVIDHHITRDKLERLKADLERLKAQIPEAKEVMQRTAEEGDFSENAGYQDAKRRLRRINARMLHLNERINRAIVIDDGPSDGYIGIGSTVIVSNGTQEKTFRIVGAQEVDLSKGWISHSSPLGSALIDKREGGTVEVNGVEWTVLRV